MGWNEFRGKVSSIADPDTGGSYTVKKYTSKKNYAADGAWQHEEIVLKPLNPAYADIVIPNAEAEDFMVVAEVVKKCNEVEQVSTEQVLSWGDV